MYTNIYVYFYKAIPFTQVCKGSSWIVVVTFLALLLKI